MQTLQDNFALKKFQNNSKVRISSYASSLELESRFTLCYVQNYC